MTDMHADTEVRPLVHCILCDREYDRKDTDRYRPLGVFDNYCLCEECLHKEKVGWRPDK